jgi:hypothetical protein
MFCKVEFNGHWLSFILICASQWVLCITNCKVQFHSVYRVWICVKGFFHLCATLFEIYHTFAGSAAWQWWGMRGIASVGPQDPFCLPVGLKLLGIDVRPWEGFGWQLFRNRPRYISHHLGYMTQLPVFHSRFSRARSWDGGLPITDVSCYCLLLLCSKLTILRDTLSVACFLVKEILAIVMTWDACVLPASFTSRLFNFFFWSATPCCVRWLPIRVSWIPYGLWPFSSTCLFSLLFKLLKSRLSIFHVGFVASLFLPLWLLQLWHSLVSFSISIRLSRKDFINFGISFVCNVFYLRVCS